MAQSLRVERHPLGPLENNTYLVWDPASNDAVIVDPTMESDVLAERVREYGLALKGIVNTHAHFDHLAGNAFFASAFHCPIMIHRDELPILREMPFHATLFGFSIPPSPEPNVLLSDGDTVKVGGGELRVLHTPGHSPGGICLLSDGFVLTGDTLFSRSIGRTDLPGGDSEALVASIRDKLFALPDDTEALPGHGPSTLIGYEKTHNPFVRP